MNHTLALIFGLAILSLIVRGAWYISEYFTRRENKKLFDSVRVGDKYILDYNGPDPFKPQWGAIITIIDKTMNKDGIAYVKYRLGSIIERTSSLSYLIELGYKPYNGQDKEV